MGRMTSELKTTPVVELEGGFVHVKRRLWRGTIRRRDDKRILWRCRHLHSRPEYNARFQEDTSDDSSPRWLVWETSALNCGREAYLQLQQEGAKVTGDFGIIGDPNYPEEDREDVRWCRVEGKPYKGRVGITDDGERRVVVEGEGAVGSLYLDTTFKAGLRLPPTANEKVIARWCTATWLLATSVWGLSFQDRRTPLASDKVLPHVLDLFFPEGPEKKPKKETVTITTPHIETRIEANQRLYDVVDGKGKILGTYRQRGKASLKLKEVTR
jgi:hypothetical protein